MGFVLALLVAMAPPSVDALVETLTRPGAEHAEKWQAAQALGLAGPAAVAPLIRALDAEPSRYYAARALGMLGRTAAPAAVSRLGRVLADRTFAPRRYAAQALGLLGDDAATTALEPALGDLEAVRLDALRALMRLPGPRSRAALLRHFVPREPGALRLTVRVEGAGTVAPGGRLAVVVELENTGNVALVLPAPGEVLAAGWLIETADGRVVAGDPVEKEDRHLLAPIPALRLEPGGRHVLRRALSVVRWDGGERYGDELRPAPPTLALRDGGRLWAVRQGGRMTLRACWLPERAADLLTAVNPVPGGYAAPDRGSASPPVPVVLVE